MTVVLVVSTSLRPVALPQKEGAAARWQRAGSRARREGERSRQGCQRLDRIDTVGRKRPRSSPTAERYGTRFNVSHDDPPKRSWTS